MPAENLLLSDWAAAQGLGEAGRRLGDLLQQEVRRAAAVDVAGGDLRVHELVFRDLHPMHIDATFCPLAPGKLLVHPERVVTVPNQITADIVVQAVSEIARTERIDVLVALEEYDVMNAAVVREHLRLAGMGTTTARLFRDKLGMRITHFVVESNIPHADGVRDVAGDFETLWYAFASVPILGRKPPAIPTLRLIWCISTRRFRARTASKSGR